MRVTGFRSAGGAALQAGIFIFLLILPVQGLTVADSGLLPAGEMAPDFEAVDITGKPFALGEELAKGPVFLIFWSIF